ncbi:hypothetical protein IFR05_013097, partial [Cadophora sp. M221]
MQRTSEQLGDLHPNVSGQGNSLLSESESSSSHDESITREQGPEVDSIRAVAPISILISTSNHPDEPSTTSALSMTVTPEVPENCTICFEIITTLCILQPCDHKFDMDCIMPWLRSVYRDSLDERALRCPLCRQVIDTIRHSILGDGTANMMIVGPHFRQQFRRQGPERPWDDLMRAADDVPVYRPAIPLLSDVGGVMTYRPSHGYRDRVDLLYRRQQEELRLEARRDSFHPHHMRDDHIEDGVFELLGEEGILNRIERMERRNNARGSDLEAMGEASVKDDGESMGITKLMEVLTKGDTGPVGISRAQVRDEHRDRANAIDNHVKWLQSPDKRDWKERTTWLPSSNIRCDHIIQDIQWGSSTPTPTTASDGLVDLFAAHHNTTHWDEEGSLTFEYARELQEKHWDAYSAIAANPDLDTPEEYINNLTHVELDVEGYDATGSRIRAQRILEINLKVHYNHATVPVTEETTMEFKRTLVLKSPAEFSLGALRPRDREPYHA